MSLLRYVFMVGVMFLGGVALFVGGVVTASAIASGTITYSYGTGAEAVARTISLATEPGAFWQRVALLGLLPMVLGTAGIWWSRGRLSLDS
jgi:hypothetical protein